MSYSPKLTSSFNNSRNKSSLISPQSGMCSLCDDGCDGSCEIGIAAIIGARAVYPTTTGANQVASEKEYPIDYSHFNINGRVFGAMGLDNPTAENATVFNVNLEGEYGYDNKVRTKLPLFLPALIKLNWKDYFAGAAMMGIPCVIGESAIDKDPNLLMKDGRVVGFEFLKQIKAVYDKYYRGYGQLILQCNYEDDMFGVPEYAIKEAGIEGIEFKFGQSAKGIQPVIRLKDHDEALKEYDKGYLVYPNPRDEAVIKAFKEGTCPNFYKYGRLPMWSEDYLKNRINKLKELGVKNIYFKMAGYDKIDIKRVIEIASNLCIDMITFDGAGGGSGYSPCKMMNEWSYPTVMLEKIVCDTIKKLPKGSYKPAITITGGFASEDQVYKALAIGDGKVTHIGLCRAAMAAAMVGKRRGEKIANGECTVDIFEDLPDLRAIYGKGADEFPPGAIGVFSYLNKIGFGLKHFAALNRKFDLQHININDVMPLTGSAEKILFNGED